MNRVLALIALMRWPNLVIIALTQLFVYAFLDASVCVQNPFVASGIWLLIGSTCCIAAGGYVINDYFDVKIDAINKPRRLIVGKVVRPRHAVLLHTFLNVAGVGLALMVDLRLALLNVAVTLLLWQYSTALKYRLLVGNIVISFMLSLAILVVYFVHDNLYLQWMYAYSGFAFLTGLAREIIKDAEDLKGDSAHGAHTLPVEAGVAKTKKVVKGLILAIILSLVLAMAYLVYLQKWVLVIYCAAAIVLPLVMATRAIDRADTRKDFGHISTQLKLIVLAGILSMALRCTFALENAHP